MRAVHGVEEGRRADSVSDSELTNLGMQPVDQEMA